jgi:hypothetical protein
MEPSSCCVLADGFSQISRKRTIADRWLIWWGLRPVRLMGLPVWVVLPVARRWSRSVGRSRLRVTGGSAAGTAGGGSRAERGRTESDLLGKRDHQFLGFLPSALPVDASEFEQNSLAARGASRLDAVAALKRLAAPRVQSLNASRRWQADPSLLLVRKSTNPSSVLHAIC